MLTVSITRSQDTTDVREVSFPFWMATEIAVDLNRLDRVESINELQGLMIDNLKQQISTLSSKILNQQQQISLLQSTNEILVTQLEAERAKDPKSGFWKWIWKVLAAGAAGFVVGSLSN